MENDNEGPNEKSELICIPGRHGLHYIDRTRSDPDKLFIYSVKDGGYSKLLKNNPNFSQDSYMDDDNINDDEEMLSDYYGSEDEGYYPAEDDDLYGD